MRGKRACFRQRPDWGRHCRRYTRFNFKTMKWKWERQFTLNKEKKIHPFPSLWSKSGYLKTWPGKTKTVCMSMYHLRRWLLCFVLFFIVLGEQSWVAAQRPEMNWDSGCTDNLLQSCRPVVCIPTWSALVLVVCFSVASSSLGMILQYSWTALIKPY